MDEEKEEVKEEPIRPIRWQEFVINLRHDNYIVFEREMAKQYKDMFPARFPRVIREMNHYLNTLLPQMTYASAIKKVLDNKTAKVRKPLVTLPSETATMFEHWLLAIGRDLLAMMWHYHLYQQDIMLVSIMLLRVVEEYTYILDNDFHMEVIMEMITVLTLRDASLELLLNSYELQDLLFRLIDLYFLGQKEWNPFSEILITLLTQFATYYDYTNQTRQNFDLMNKVIGCYQFVISQQKATRKMQLEEMPFDLKPDEQEYMDLGLEELYATRFNQNKNEKKMRAQQQRLEQEKEKGNLQILDDHNNPLKLFQQVPDETMEMVEAAMATFPKQICTIEFYLKHELFTKLFNKGQVFFIALALKILQALTIDPENRSTTLITTYHLIEDLQQYSHHRDFFIMCRESIRALNSLLFSFDDMILWLKFDTKNIHNDNSNYLKTQYSGRVELKPYGDPYKLPLNAGLYFDGCGVDFRIGDGLEVVGMTHDFTEHRTLRSGFQFPSQISIAFWFVYFSQETQKTRTNLLRTGKIHTLITCDDDITPLFFADPTFMMMGVMNVGSRNKELSAELQSVGMKFFEINLELSTKVFQGWNHVIVTFDNQAYESTLFLNGHSISTIKRVQFNLSAKYIGNSKDGSEPFGYLCDMRIYNRILNTKEIKYLCTYDKTIKLLCNKEQRDVANYRDVLSKFINNKVLSDLRRIIQDTSQNNSEGCAMALQCVSLMCFASTRMRLEAAKQGVFELASQLVHNPDPVVSKFAKQVMVSVW